MLHQYDTQKEINDTQKKVDELIQKFAEEITRLPRSKYGVLEASQIINIVKTNLDSSIKTINEQKELNNINLIKGLYDEDIINCKNTVQLSEVIQLNNRDFAQRLFFIDRVSKEALEFWFTNGAKLPKDALGLSVVLGCNIHALQYVKQQGYFGNLNEKDVTNLLEKAKKFEEKNKEGISFLKDNLNVQPLVLKK